jgi:hypothetical protein
LSLLGPARRLACALFLVAAGAIAGCAGAAPIPAERWAMHADGRTLAIISVSADPDAFGRWIVELDRPAGTAISGGHVVSGMTAAAEHRRLRSLLVGPDVPDHIGPEAFTRGSLTLKYVDPAPDQADDLFQFAQIDDDHAMWSVQGVPFEPILLVRARPGESIDHAWERGREYPLDEPWPSNAEMARLFDADQAARTSDHIDWDVVAPQDAARRARVRTLLGGGALRSADDYWRAAFIFQHGDKPEDYLLAHGLAIIAAAKGRRDAPWIAAATLDRYLQAIGQKQVYGTQYRLRPGVPTTQEPYDRTTISDAMRVATGVPTQADQEKRRAEYDRQSATATAPKP